MTEPMTDDRFKTLCHRRLHLTGSEADELFAEVVRCHKQIAMIAPTKTTFPLDEGVATLSWPEGITEKSFGDLEAWIHVALSRIARSAAKNSKIPLDTCHEISDTVVDGDQE